jgi:hypothetical protein
VGHKELIGTPLIQNRSAASRCHMLVEPSRFDCGKTEEPGFDFRDFRSGIWTQIQNFIVV